MEPQWGSGVEDPRSRRQAVKINSTGHSAVTTNAQNTYIII